MGRTASLATRGRAVAGLPLRELGGHDQSAALERTAPPSARARARGTSAGPMTARPAPVQGKRDPKHNQHRGASDHRSWGTGPQERTPRPLGSLAA